MLKFIKMRLFKKTSGGFTLAEVIISCALLGILILGVIMFVSPILETVGNTNTCTQASNVAKSIEYYISRSIRNAAYITILDKENAADVVTDYSDIIDQLQQQGEVDNYSLKCISIRRLLDNKSKTYKYFICNEEVGSAIDLNTPTLVFDPCYFDGIYPKVTIRQVSQKKEDGTPDPDKYMPAVEIKVDLYDGVDMRDSKTNLSENDLIFSGKGYTVFRNIEMYADLEDDDKPSILPRVTKQVGKFPPPVAGDEKDSIHNDDDHNDTFIFYVERTLSASTTT